MSVAKKIAAASDKAFNTSRTCVVIEGFQVPHVHIKLYPISKTSGVEALTDVIIKTAPTELAALETHAAQIKVALE